MSILNTRLSRLAQVIAACRSASGGGRFRCSLYTFVAFGWHDHPSPAVMLSQDAVVAGEIDSRFRDRKAAFIGALFLVPTFL